MTLIKASSSLRNNYKELSKLSHSTGQPIHITLNGEGDTVLLSNEMYEQIEEKLALLEFYENLGVNIMDKLSKAEDQHLAGAATNSHDDIMFEMRHLIDQPDVEDN